MLDRTSKIKDTTVDIFFPFGLDTKIDSPTIKQPMQELPVLNSFSDYESAKLKYQKACQEIPSEDSSGQKSIWADKLCLRLLDFEFEHGIEL